MTSNLRTRLKAVEKRLDREDQHRGASILDRVIPHGYSGQGIPRHEFLGELIGFARDALERRRLSDAERLQLREDIAQMRDTIRSDKDHHFFVIHWTRTTLRVAREHAAERPHDPEPQARIARIKRELRDAFAAMREPWPYSHKDHLRRQGHIV